MTATQRLGVLLMALPLSEVRRLAKLADQQGFENAWFPEITFSDAFIPVAAASLETSRIRLATGVVGIWSRSPAAMALTTATLNQFCNGRLILGLGLQARSYVENWHGVAYERPVRAMREYVTILRQILTGEIRHLRGGNISNQEFPDAHSSGRPTYSDLHCGHWTQDVTAGWRVS